MWTALPSSDYYEPSAPPHGRRRTTRQPAPSAPGWRRETGTTGWFPRSPRTDQRRRCPALPQRPRHGYAADLHHGLPAGFPNPTRKSPAPDSPAPPARVRTATQPLSPGFELVRLLRGFRALVSRVHLSVSLDEPTPSGNPDASRRCRGCLPPSPAPPGSDCPQLRQAAATTCRCRYLTSTRLHGASWRTGKYAQTFTNAGPNTSSTT
jgi:hypothetical protein